MTTPICSQCQINITDNHNCDAHTLTPKNMREEKSKINELVERELEEFDKKFVIYSNKVVKEQDTETHTSTKIIHPLYHENYEEIKSFIHAFSQKLMVAVKEELKMEERPDLRKTKGHKETCTSCADDRAYNQAIQELNEKLEKL